MPIVTLSESTPATINDRGAGRADARSWLLQRSATIAYWTRTRSWAAKMWDVFTLGRQNSGRDVLAGRGRPEKLVESHKSGVPLPSPHSALFAPDYAPAITTA